MLQCRGLQIYAELKACFLKKTASKKSLNPGGLERKKRKFTKKSQVRGVLFTAQMLELNFKIYTIFYFILRHGQFIV